VRFGRKSASSSSTADLGVGGDEDNEGVADGATAAEEPLGPFDESEVDLEEFAGVDLGSLLITPVGAAEMQLQVDEDSGQVMAAVLVGENGALELRAFAASRGGGAWDELRPRIAAEMARQGGTCDERQGSFGTELLCLVPVRTPAGEPATQTSRIIGYEGPTWLLRATLMGPPAQDEELAASWEETIRRVVVRRGTSAMPPGAPLPLTLPAEARRVEPPSQV
jgi:hypothetical protein